MSDPQLPSALDAHASDLENQAAQAEISGSNPPVTHATMLRTIGKLFHDLALRIQGHPPEPVALDPLTGAPVPEPAPLDVTQAGTVTEPADRGPVDPTQESGSPGMGAGSASA